MVRHSLERTCIVDEDVWRPSALPPHEREQVVYPGGVGEVGTVKVYVDPASRPGGLALLHGRFHGARLAQAIDHHLAAPAYQHLHAKSRAMVGPSIPALFRALTLATLSPIPLVPPVTSANRAGAPAIALLAITY